MGVESERGSFTFYARDTIITLLSHPPLLWGREGGRKEGDVYQIYLAL